MVNASVSPHANVCYSAQWFLAESTRGGVWQKCLTLYLLVLYVLYYCSTVLVHYGRILLLPVSHNFMVLVYYVLTVECLIIMLNHSF